MVEQIVALCRELGGEENTLLVPLAHAVQEDLCRRLKPGLTPEDCAEVFPLACALAVMGTLQEITGEDRLTAFTAGEVTIRTEGACQSARAARRLLSPWMGDEGFCVRGVRG